MSEKKPPMPPFNDKDLIALVLIMAFFCGLMGALSSDWVFVIPAAGLLLGALCLHKARPLATARRKRRNTEEQEQNDEHQ